MGAFGATPFLYPIVDTAVCLARSLDPVDLAASYFAGGARGTFDGQGFPRSARREIRYLERLKASREYREALGEVVPQR